MAERTVVIGSKVGLHARPAALFTKAVAATGLPVTIRKGDGAPVPAASILSVLTLGVSCGDEVTITLDGEAAGPDRAAAVLDDLAGLLASDLDA